MKTGRAAYRVGVAFAMLLSAAAARADEVALEPIRDTTLIESATGSLGNGSGPALFTGRTAQSVGSLRRGLIVFDIAGAVPPGATITSVTLKLTLAQTAGPADTIVLHKVLADWGEGASTGSGGGSPAQDGDATWLHTFFPGQLWMTPGGDFDPAPHAATLVDQPGSYTWGSTQQMVADAQSWLDLPADNHGWILIGGEVVPQTAKRFDSRESTEAILRPILSVEYEPMCLPDPVGPGYWQHRCAVGPGGFEEVLDCADRMLTQLGLTPLAACEAIRPDTSPDCRAKALRKLTSIILNLCDGRVQTSCEVDASDRGCVSSTIGGLIDEMAQLLEAGDCRQAMRCAGGLD